MDKMLSDDVVISGTNVNITVQDQKTLEKIKK